MKFLQLIFLLFGSILFAQNLYSLNGKLVNQENQPINLSEIYLYDEKRNLINSQISENSTFEFINLPVQKYYLTVITTDSTEEIPLFLLDENKNITYTIHEDSITIDEVLINAKKKTFKMENGNLTIDVANSVFNKSTNPTDLFSKLPSVMLGADRESLTIIGKGNPLLYIGNQKVDFNAINTLSVDDIKSIEIIKNSTAQYEAEGKAVIKITLKNSKKDGFKVNLQETLSFKKKYNNYFNSNFQFRKNKSEFKINAAYNVRQAWESNGFDYLVSAKNIQSNYIIKSQTKQPNFILGTSFFQELNPDGDYLTLSLNGNFKNDKGLIDTNTNYSDDNKNEHILTLNKNHNQRNYTNSLFNYNKVIKSINATLLTGFQFTNFSKSTNYIFSNNINDTGFEYNQTRNQKYQINAYAGRLDFEKIFDEKTKIELGGSFTKAAAKTNNKTEFAIATSTQFLKYKFDELNTAFYSQFSSEIKKINYKVGLRLETTNSDGFNEILAQKDINKNYVDWFPNAQISYQIDDKKEFSLSYNRTIDRPDYGSISSGNLYGSPYVEYGGNFNILPTYTNTVTGNIALNKWAINASFYQSKNLMGYTLVYDDKSDISTFTAVNFEKENGYSVGLDVPFEWEIWSSQNSFSVNYNKTQDSTAILRKSTPYLYFYSNNIFKIAKDFNFIINGYWLTKRTEGIYERNAQIIANLGLTKKIKDFDLTLNYNDLFKQLEFREVLAYGKISSKNVFFVDSPEFSISLKYNFGKISKSNYKENKVNEDENRIR